MVKNSLEDLWEKALCFLDWPLDFSNLLRNLFKKELSHKFNNSDITLSRLRVNVMINDEMAVSGSSHSF